MSERIRNLQRAPLSQSLRSLLILGSLIILSAGSVHASDPETEVAKLVGKVMAEAFAGEDGLVRDPLLAGWVERTGARLSAQSPRQHLTYHFAVLDTAEPNAFTLPGGYVFVTRGLLDFVRSRDVLAGVMAHELGHVAGHHPIRAMEWGVASSLALRYGPFQRSEAEKLGATGAIYLSTLYFSRTVESQADHYGIRFATMAGYDPHGLVQFFEDLGPTTHPGFLDRYLSTHPPLIDRIRSLEKTPYLDARNSRLQEEIADRLLADCRPAVALRHYQAAAAGNLPSADLPGKIAAIQRQIHRAAPDGGASPQPPVPVSPAVSVLPPVPASPAAAADLESARLSLQQTMVQVRKRTDATRRSLGQMRSMESLNSLMQNGLLGAASIRTDDLRWLALAVQAYGLVNRLEDVFALTARVEGGLPYTLSDMSSEMLEPHTPAGEDTIAVPPLLREARSAADEDLQASQRLVKGVALLTGVMADLDSVLLVPQDRFSNLRFGATQAALIAAKAEIDGAHHLAAHALRTASTAEDRVLVAKIDRLGASGDATALQRFDCNTGDLFGVAPEQVARWRQDLPYGDGVLAGALAVETGSTLDRIRTRQRQRQGSLAAVAPVTWVDAIEDEGGSPVSIEIMLRQVAQVLQEEGTVD